jgi:hypothetical protein
MSRSVRSETGQQNQALGGAKAIALLWSFGVKKRPPGYKYLAPLGRSDNDVLLHFEIEFQISNFKSKI